MNSKYLLPLITLAAAVGLFMPYYPIQLIASLVLMGVLPGYALVKFLDIPLFNTAEQLLIGVATSYALTITLVLGYVFIGLPLNTVSLAIGLIGLTGLLLGATHFFPSKPLPITHPTFPPETPWLVGLLTMAAFFRLYHVEYSDYQGDEAGILLQAVAIFQGNLEAILTRFKGPGEVFVLNAIGGLTDNMDQLTMRIPFSVASIAAVGLIFLLGQRLANRHVGIIAAALMVIEGMYVSYARTAQYQNVLLPLTLASLLCFYHYYQSPTKSLRLHGLGTFLLAVAFLLHFETLFLFPVVIYLTVADLPLSPEKWQNHLTRLLTCWPSLLIFITTTGSFYLPYLLHPKISHTGSYLEGRISSGGQPPFNNIDHFFYMEALKYNSAYYVITFSLILLAIIIVTFQRSLAGVFPQPKSQSANPPSLWGGVTAITIIGLSILLVNLAQYRLLTFILALSLALFFITIIFSPTTPQVQRTLWLWIAPASWVYLFLVNRPGKHHYLFWSALLLLIALALQWLARQKPHLNKGFMAMGLIAWLIMAGHTYMVMLRPDLEYVLTYPRHQPWLYPTAADFPFSSRIGFGYPYRLGWQAISQLKRAGQFEGSWAANDEGNTLTWYTLDTPQTACYPHYVIQSEIAYKGDEGLPLAFDPKMSGYVTRYHILTNDELRMTVWEFAPDSPPTEPQELRQLDQFPLPLKSSDFPLLSRDLTPSPQIALNPPMILGEGSELKLNAPPEYLARAQQLNGRIALLGYDLDTQYKSMLPVTLYWQTQTTLNLRYKIFVHLMGADGHVWSQADDFPACGTTHANQWKPGEIIPDRHLLKLPSDLPNGEYTLQIGFYEPDLNLRLNYFDIANNEQGNYLSVKIEK